MSAAHFHAHITPRHQSKTKEVDEDIRLILHTHLSSGSGSANHTRALARLPLLLVVLVICSLVLLLAGPGECSELSLQVLLVSSCLPEPRLQCFLRPSACTAIYDCLQLGPQISQPPALCICQSFWDRLSVLSTCPSTTVCCCWCRTLHLQACTIVVSAHS